MLVLSSIRKPKRLIIRGDDEKDHMFLVKGGEDLRLDQRIEQVSERLEVYWQGLELYFDQQPNLCYGRPPRNKKSERCFLS